MLVGLVFDVWSWYRTRLRTGNANCNKKIDYGPNTDRSAKITTEYDHLWTTNTERVHQITTEFTQETIICIQNCRY